MGLGCRDGPFQPLVASGGADRRRKPAAVFDEPVRVQVCCGQRGPGCLGSYFQESLPLPLAAGYLTQTDRVFIAQKMLLSGSHCT